MFVCDCVRLSSEELSLWMGVGAAHLTVKNRWLLKYSYSRFVNVLRSALPDWPHVLEEEEEERQSEGREEEEGKIMQEESPGE